MQLVQRRLTAKIAHSLKTDRICALMGPRQAGKTTLVRRLLQSDRELRYYNLKDPSIRKVLKENGQKEFDHFKEATIILDEVQTVPSLLELIQIHVDEHPGRKGQFLLLGSNHLLLNRHIRESLAGRVALFTLLPLALTEMLEKDRPTLLELLLNAENIHACESILAEMYVPVGESSQAGNLLADLNLFGGYPEFLERKNPGDRTDWLAHYHQTYLETDLRQLVELRNTESFETFEQMFALRVANLMNMSELARDCGLSVDTMRRFIGYYRQLFIAWQAKPYHVNIGKRMMKMSKYYFYDTGMLRSVLGNFAAVTGQFFENTVLAEIQKILSFSSIRHQLYFARTATGVEVDGYLENRAATTRLFMEIKQADTVRRQDIRHLKKYTGADPGGLGLLLYNGNGVLNMDQRIWAVPAVWLLA
jgi:predicted AAA+ superfamily ATPase